MSDLNHIWHVGWSPDVFLKFEFRIGHSPNFGATGSQKSLLSIGKTNCLYNSL